jgi:hypothetical protein
LHGRLTAWDLATALAQRASAPVEVLVDVDSLEHGENPVNLNMHHHEELVARSKEEVLEYQSLMEKPTSERVEGLRGWYRKCIDRASSRDNNRQCSVKDLDFSALCKAVEEAKAVRFLGGSSLWTLQRFIEKDLAHLLQCHLQVVCLVLDSCSAKYTLTRK